jgi:hypothetical protein
MKIISALAGGFAGACAMTLLHETIRRFDKDAPRMDLMGMEALGKGINKVTGKVPDEDTLYGGALAGEVASNTLYYSMAGIGEEKTDLKGTVLGIAAGLGGIYLPGILGLNQENSARTDKTKALTAIYYSVGGLVAAQVMEWVEEKLTTNNRQEALSINRTS